MVQASRRTSLSTKSDMPSLSGETPTQGFKSRTPRFQPNDFEHLARALVELEGPRKGAVGRFGEGAARPPLPGRALQVGADARHLHCTVFSGGKCRRQDARASESFHPTREREETAQLHMRKKGGDADERGTLPLRRDRGCVGLSMSMHEDLDPLTLAVRHSSRREAHRRMLRSSFAAKGC
jgi:hypothetical protein